MVPGVSEIVEKSDCGCTRGELLRMEKVILDKLQWDLKRVTALDFLHIVSQWQTLSQACGSKLQSEQK